MEELQDAIEDAQYVNAIATQEDGPRPVLAWEIPTEEQINSWKEKVLRQEPKAYSLEWTLQSAIGLFLFSAFLKETCNDHVRINFCEEVIRWRKLRGGQRVEKTKRIIAAYLCHSSSSSPPYKTEIDEYDLERIHVYFDDLETLVRDNFDESFDESFVGLTGPVRDEILAKMDEVEQARARYKRERESRKEESPVPTVTGEKDTDIAGTADSTGIKTTNEGIERSGAMHDVNEESSSINRDNLSRDLSVSTLSSKFRLITTKPDFGPRFIPDDFFDEAEAIVMESLRKQYWETFLESEHYTKLMNFLWYQDRRVVPDDFFVMRVLGRGGFGLVTGTYEQPVSFDDELAFYTSSLYQSMQEGYVWKVVRHESYEQTANKDEEVRTACAERAYCLGCS
jgi:hypothetical protein